MATTAPVLHQHPLQRSHYVLLALFFAVLVWSLIRPYTYTIWLLESFPALIGLLVLAFTWRRFQFTTLLYTLMCLHAIILMVGGHYTYAQVPLFNWISQWLELGRNQYDRLGHFAQGLVPAMIAREIFIRRRIVRRGGWTRFLPICVAMAISACYELLEYAVAIVSNTAGNEFLGSQGDPWDTQNDMLMALIGSSAAMLFMTRWHDRAIATIEPVNAEQEKSR